MPFARSQTMKHDHAVWEDLEREAHQDMFYATPESVRRALGWQCVDKGGALVSVAGNAPSILLNRTLGLGIGEPATARMVREIRRLYADEGVSRYFLSVSPYAEPLALRGWLAEERLELQRRWMKFWRDNRPAPGAATAYRVGRIEGRHASSFGRIVAAAFDLGEDAEGIFRSLWNRPRWHLCGAFADDTLVGAGAVFVQGELAYVGYGATDPAHRGRGAQSALLAARIDAARELGCKVMITETGEAVPGDPQHSYHNIVRSGFTEGYLRDNYAPRR